MCIRLASSKLVFKAAQDRLSKLTLICPDQVEFDREPRPQEIHIDPGLINRVVEMASLEQLECKRSILRNPASQVHSSTQ